MTPEQITANPLLGNYAQNSARQMVDPIASFIAGEVAVTAQFGRFKKYSDSHRFKLPNTLRPRGEDGTFLTMEATDGTYSLEANALNFGVDISEEMEDGETIDLMQEGIDDVSEVQGLVITDTVIQGALSAGGAGTDLDLGAADDPIKQLKAKIYDVAKAARISDLSKIGIVLGPTMELELTTHPKVLARKSGGGKAISVSLEELKAMIGLPIEIRLSTYIKDTSAEGLDAEDEFLLDGDLLIFVRNPNPTRRDPSFMKRFVLRAGWMQPRAWRLPSGRGMNGGVDWYHDIQVTNTEAIFRYKLAA